MTWIDRLRTDRNSQTAASDLYCGEYWSVVRSLPSAAGEFGVTPRIWICSAGYGLISPQSRICSYGATFSPYERDSVTRGFDADARRIAARKWWRRISRWSGPSGSKLRSLTAIARNTRRRRSWSSHPPIIYRRWSMTSRVPLRLYRGLISF